jgi:hypothetical protein
MNVKLLRRLAAGLVLSVAASAALSADITLYERGDFRGRSFTANGPVQDFGATGFNDRVSSVAIQNGSWELCSDANFGGNCVRLDPGNYPSLRSMGMNNAVSSARPLRRGGGGGGGGGRIALYDAPNFNGRVATLDSDVPNFGPLGINDRVASAIVYEGTWQVCEHADFQGRCVTLGPGRHPDLGRMDDRVSSARLESGAGPVPPGPPGGPGRQARAILFEGSNLSGRSFGLTNEVVPNLGNTPFNDRASSLRVEAGFWIFCSDANFQGECRTFGPGDYPTLPWDLNNRISSGRRIVGHYPYAGNPNWNVR